MPESILVLRDAILAALLMASAVTDLRERRIYNALTYPAILAGWALALLGGPGAFGSALAGAALGAACFTPLVLVGGMGLGDLKLMAAVGALGGFVLAAAALIDAALAGGVIAAGLLLVRRGGPGPVLRRVAAVPGAVWLALRTRGRRRMTARRGEVTVPYGVAIALGTLVARMGRWPW